MKQLNITIHPFSALAGMVLLGLVWVTAGAMPLQGSSSTRDVSAIQDVNDPHPRDYVRVIEGVPFTVPAGKIFVMRGLGASSPYQQPYNQTVYVDGIPTFSERFGWSSDGYQHHGKEVPTPGIGADAGSVVTTSTTSSNIPGIVLGYLVDA
jgi:hypothetical protein